MTEAVVDDLESVDVEEKYGDEIRSPGLANQRVLEAVLEQGAIGKARQVVMERLVDEPRLKFAALGDVGDRARDPDEA